jgi:hypothetical protein
LGDIKGGLVYRAPGFDADFEQELLRLGSAGQPAVPTLVEKLGDGGYDHEDVHWVAGEVLRHISPTWQDLPVTRAAIPSMLEKMFAGGFYVVKPAVEYLDRIAPGWSEIPEAAAAVPALIEQLVAGNRDVLAGARVVLDRIDPSWGHQPQARAGVPALIEKLTAEGFYLPTVADILDHINPAWPQRPEAHALLPELLVAASRQHLQVAQMKRILDAIDPVWPCLPQVRATVPILIRMMAGAEDSIFGQGYEIDGAIRKAANDFLHGIDPAWHQLPEAHNAVPALVAQIKRGSGRASEVLDRIDPLWREKDRTLKTPAPIRPET